MTNAQSTVDGLSSEGKLFGKPRWMGLVALFATILACGAMLGFGYALVSPAVISASLASVVTWSLWVAFWAYLIVVIGVWSMKLPKRK